MIDDDEVKKGIVDLNTVNKNNFMQFNRFEGASFGKNPDMFRVYDKIKQIKNQNISNLIMTKWELNDFDLARDVCVFRHEVEFGRARIKKLIPLNLSDEIGYIFANLGKFWATGLQICKWYDLTDAERQKLSNNTILTDSFRKIYQRCEQDNNRFKLWDIIADWDESRFVELSKHDLLKTRDMKQAKKALKALISAVYVNMGVDYRNFELVLEEVKKDLDYQGLNLHEYGLSKLAGSFNKNEKVINDCNLDIENPLTSSLYFALDDMIKALIDVS